MMEDYNPRKIVCWFYMLIIDVGLNHNCQHVSLFGCWFSNKNCKPDSPGMPLAKFCSRAFCPEGGPLAALGNPLASLGILGGVKGGPRGSLGRSRGVLGGVLWDP